MNYLKFRPMHAQGSYQSLKGYWWFLHQPCSTLAFYQFTQSWILFLCWKPCWYMSSAYSSDTSQTFHTLVVQQFLETFFSLLPPLHSNLASTSGSSASTVMKNLEVCPKFCTCLIILYSVFCSPSAPPTGISSRFLEYFPLLSAEISWFLFLDLLSVVFSVSNCFVFLFSVLSENPVVPL